jgi:hypothetical protein
MGMATLYLECQLSEEEIRERMRELTTAEIARSAAEVELAGETAKWSTHKKELESKISAASSRCRELANAAKTGREMRNVDCVTEIHPPHHQTIRTDTGEVIRTRAATVEELQIALPLSNEGPVVDAEVPDEDDEEAGADEPEGE